MFGAKIVSYPFDTTPSRPENIRQHGTAVVSAAHRRVANTSAMQRAIFYKKQPMFFFF
jgi:hypothetical protein